jgi:hypothetical protein
MTLVSLVGTVTIFFTHRDLYLKIATSFISLMLFWLLFVPFFYLPVVPAEVVQLVKDKEVATYYRKPYFIEESLNRKITWLNASTCVSYPEQHRGAYIILRKVQYHRCHLENSTTIVKSWPNWIKGKNPKEIISALKTGKIKELQEEMLLIKSVF